MKVKSHLSHLNTQSVKKCSKVQKLKTTFRKSWESKRSLINFDKFLTCDLPSSLLQKRVSVGGDGAIRIASGLQNPKYFKKRIQDISKYFQHIILKIYPRHILESSKRLSICRVFFDWFLKVVSACWVLKILVPPILIFEEKKYKFTERKKFSKSALKRSFRHFQQQTVIQIRIVSSVSLL